MFSVPGVVNISECRECILDNLSVGYMTHGIEWAHFIGEYSSSHHTQLYYTAALHLLSLSSHSIVVVNLPGHISNAG